MSFEANDELWDWIPANPVVGSNRPYAPCEPDRTLFPQSEAEKRYAINLRTRIDYDAKTESLVVQCHLNPVDWADLKHALARYREEEQRVVRRIVLYIDPEIFRDQFLELKYRKFEREEGPLERAANGQFVVVKTLKVKEVKEVKEVEGKEEK